MEVRKAMEPDSTPIEAGKSLCDLGLTWLTRLLNKILKTKRYQMSGEKRVP